MKYGRLNFLCVLLALAMVLCGCTPSKGNADTQKNDTDNKLTIVTSFYPIYIATINITKGVPGVEVVNMTKPQTGCLHDYQLTTQDLKTLENADVFVINGAGMETFLDKVISQQKDLKIVNASQGITLIKDNNGDDNPHVWVSISNEITQVKNISEQLSKIDIQHAKIYSENADAYIEKLEALQSKMHASLDSIKNKDIITFHEAFPYFAQEFGFNIVAVIEREPGTSPTPKEIEQTVEIINNSNVKVLFVEPQYSAKAADMIAAETGAKIYELDPIVTGDANPDGYDEYIKAMEQNLKTLQEALK